MDISGKTVLTGLIGSPVAHSISPAMHNEAFRLLGLDYRYLAFDLKDKDLKTAVYGLRELGARGFNITMPYKNDIPALMDKLTPAAELAGACNTVIIEPDGTMIGHTTDGIGFMSSVTDEGYDIRGKRLAILGAGGAATAIIVQAALDGVSEIDIYRRNKTEAFARTCDFARKVTEGTDCRVRVFDINDADNMRERFADTALLVNATNVGMAPDVDKTPIDCDLLHKGLIVADIIYNPRKTLLMKKAEEIGCAVFNGMYMLLFQGAASFKCWTGQDMPVEDIKEKYFKK